MFRPLINLFTITKSLFHRDVIDSINLMSQRQDENGLVWMGLDTQKFWAWKILKYLFWYRFGPTVLVMNQNIIHQLLMNHKVDNDGIFLGNITTEAVKKYIGTDNIFHPQNKEQHERLRNYMVNYFSSSISLPDIQNFKEIKINAKQWTSDIADQMLLYLILGHQNFRDDIILAIKDLRNLVHGKIPMFFAEERQILIHDIFESYCNKAYNQKIGLVSVMDNAVERQQMTEMLLTVGQPNLASALCSILLYMSQHVEEQDIPFSTKNELFAKIMKSAPPVWIQARKVKKDFTINNILFPKGCLILIPRFNTDMPFSMGPNRCAGRMIALPILDHVIGKIQQEYVFSLENNYMPKMHGAVALTYDSANIIFSRKTVT